MAWEPRLAGRSWQAMNNSWMAQKVMSDSLHCNAGSLLCTQPLSRVGNANSGSLCVVILSCYLESIMGFPDLLWGLLRPEQGAGQGPLYGGFPLLTCSPPRPGGECQNKRLTSPSTCFTYPFCYSLRVGFLLPVPFFKKFIYLAAPGLNCGM